MAQAKRPAKPYAAKADGSSYCQLVGGPWDKLWVRMYPSPRWDKEVEKDYHFPLDLDMAGDLYFVQPNPQQVNTFPHWRQVQYVYDRTLVEA